MTDEVAMDPREIMLDLETMGTKRFSPVIAIGAVRFEMKGDITAFTDIFYQPISLESCLEIGLKPSASTIEWWITNPEVQEKAKRLLTDPNRVALPIALDAFTDWINSAPDHLWGNSASFDCGLLDDCYTACGKIAPWEFYNERCYRTVKNLPGAKAVELERFGAHHNALDDAISQAVHLQRIYKALKLA